MTTTEKAASPQQAGEQRMILNGSDENGAPVASGRYVAKMAGGGFAREMGMTLLK